MSGIENNSFVPMDILPPHLRIFRTSHVQTRSNNTSEVDLVGDHARSDHMTHERRHGSTRNQPLQREISLGKMGFNRDCPIDWSNIKLPLKSDLHKMIHYKITNYINPDLFVKIGNHEYRCHLLVLQCYSKFFLDKTASHIELPEAHVSKSAFAYLYDWMLHAGGDSYTLLRRDIILEIFMAAQYLQVKELEEQCWAFIDSEEFFAEDRAFMLYLNARSLCNTAIMELMVPRIQRFFLTLVASKDFLELVAEEISVFLRSNYICIHCEMEVFMSAVRWLMFDWEKRQKHLVEVMSCVRFGLISPWQLVDIRRNPENQEFLLVTKHAEVSKMIEDGLAFATVKYWHGQEPSEYTHWIEVLGLTEPVPRNWDGPSNVNEQRRYSTYQEFLVELNKYRGNQLTTLKGKGDRTSEVSSDSQLSDLDQAGKSYNTADFIIPFRRK